mgnify:CR=1 FL=1
MEKINMPLDIEKFYLREISNYFKRNKTFRYKEIAKIISKIANKEISLFCIEVSEEYQTQIILIIK